MQNLIAVLPLIWSQFWTTPWWYQTSVIASLASFAVGMVLWAAWKVRSAW